MLQSELVELADRIRSRKAESQTIEVKAAHRGCPEKLRDTLSSFSNQDGGGIILFGIDEEHDFAFPFSDDISFQPRRSIPHLTCSSPSFMKTD